MTDTAHSPHKPHKFNIVYAQLIGAADVTTANAAAHVIDPTLVGTAKCAPCDVYYGAPTCYPPEMRHQMAKDWVMEHNTGHILGTAA